MAVYRPDLKGGGLFAPPGEAPVPVEPTSKDFAISPEKAREHIAAVYKRLKFPQKSLDEYRADYDTTVVHDYGDTYHWTDEERAKANKHYELFAKYNRGLRKIRKIPEYIRKYREYLSLVRLIADENGIYEPEEFLDMYANKDIIIYGLVPPILSGIKRLKKRKSINFAELAEFIMGDEDPGSFFMTTDVKDFDPGNMDDVRSVVPEEIITEITEYKESKEEKRLLRDIGFMDKSDIEGWMPVATDGNRKKLFKTLPVLKGIMSQLQKDWDKASETFNFYGGFSLGNELEKINRYESKRNSKKNKPPKFKGSIFDDSDFEDWVEKMDEWTEEHTYVEVHDSKLTQEEAHELWAREMLEKHGFDVRKLPTVIAEQKSEIERLKERDAKFMSVRDRLLKSSMEISSSKKIQKVIKEGRKKNKFAQGKQSFATFETPEIANMLNEAMKYFEKDRKKESKNKAKAKKLNTSAPSHTSSFDIEDLMED